MQAPLVRLQCGCNSYEWGKQGSTSVAASLASATGFEIDNSKPYAELWMGTHPSLPSKDLETQRTLLDLVEDNQALMSSEINRKYRDKLPFLFKILSISKALSIQAHPNKKLAEKLHAKDPQHYPDDNHKPEMTIALNPFIGLCGFRPLSEISHFLSHVEPLRMLVGESTVEAFLTTVRGHEHTTSPTQITENKRALQTAFSALMRTATTSSNALQSATETLIERAKTSPASFASGGDDNDTTSASSLGIPGPDLARFIQTLHDQFPGDVGLFVVFFLNIVHLEPGEAMFLKADDIHAYLSGDIVECMAASDNVVRAGFTPKFKDVDTLTEMLTYSYAPIEEQKMVPTDYTFVKLNTVAYSTESECVLYDPPIEEFAVVKTDLNAPGAKATFEAIDGPSIIICVGGEGTVAVGGKIEEMKVGYVYFVGATAECVIESTDEERFVTFKAFCELDGESEEPTSNGHI
ncbi:MAG: Mannose-6-phosphate isomerase [Alyxoria varia]|nr:MAG: Mannose-6-phosphate isomerase [Alyxoria varia]